MKFFGQLIKTAVNLAIIPIPVVMDMVDVAKTTIGEPLPEKSHTMEHLEKLKNEASDE